MVQSNDNKIEQNNKIDYNTWRHRNTCVSQYAHDKEAYCK